MVSTNYNFNTNTQYGGPNISQQTNINSTSTPNVVAQPDSFGGIAQSGNSWYGSMQSFASVLGSVGQTINIFRGPPPAPAVSDEERKEIAAENITHSIFEQLNQDVWEDTSAMEQELLDAGIPAEQVQAILDQSKDANFDSVKAQMRTAIDSTQGMNKVQAQEVVRNKQKAVLQKLKTATQERARDKILAAAEKELDRKEQNEFAITASSSAETMQATENQRMAKANAFVAKREKIEAADHDSAKGLNQQGNFEGVA